jgi:hypothetical protein
MQPNPAAHLERVGPSSDYCNRAWLLSGNIRSLHHTLFETDDRTFEVLHTGVLDDEDETRDIRRIAGPFDTIGEALAWFASNRE